MIKRETKKKIEEAAKFTKKQIINESEPWGKGIQSENFRLSDETEIEKQKRLNEENPLFKADFRP